MPEKLSKYNTFFSSAFKALTKKTICTKVKYVYFLQRLRHLQKNRLYKSKVHLFSSAFKALTKKTYVPKVQI